MHKVLDGADGHGALFIGNFFDSLSLAGLQREKITHILSLRERSGARKQDIEYKYVEALDTPEFDIAACFSDCFAFIHNARHSGGNVLVHCTAGVSRSVTIAVAYIVTVTGLDWDIALTAITARRPCACPNEGFRRQLIVYQANAAAAEHARLRARYPVERYRDNENVLQILEEYMQRRELPQLASRIADTRLATGKSTADLDA